MDRKSPHEDISREKWVFSNMYKYNAKTSGLSQQQRREVFLKEQKEKRHSEMDSHRDIPKLIEDIDSEVFEDEFDTESSFEQSGELNPPKKTLKFMLMKSEWFTDIPDDLEDNWFVKFCPEGFRVLLIAKRHRTICYSEKGKFLFRLKSHLPGGGLDQPHGMTVLDCIYNKNIKTIFILDCLYWNTMPLLDSEASFRFYWLKSKFADNLRLKETSNVTNIVLMDEFPAHRPIIQDEMFKPLKIKDNIILYDGVVFYHKESHYYFGYSPLMGWLSSYMLSEKIGIDVLPENMSKKPEDYVCLEDYLSTLSARIKNKKKFAKKMDVT